jgi:hypothetical protein
MHRNGHLWEMGESEGEGEEARGIAESSQANLISGFVKNTDGKHMSERQKRNFIK